MTNLETFLAHAIELERDAARRFEDLAEAMGSAGNKEVQQFFARMAGYSRLHLAQAVERGGFRDVPVLAPGEFKWPDGSSPEVAAWEGVDAFMDTRGALQLALESEQRGLAWYAAAAAITRDPELRALAEEFATEEAEHVEMLEKMIANCTA